MVDTEKALGGTRDGTRLSVVVDSRWVMVRAENIEGMKLFYLSRDEELPSNGADYCFWVIMMMTISDVTTEVIASEVIDSELIPAAAERAMNLLELECFFLRM